MDDVAEVAASAGACRRLVGRKAAELLDELCRFCCGGGVGQMNVRVQNATTCKRWERRDPKLAGLTKCPTAMFNKLLSIFRRWNAGRADAIGRP